MNHFKHSRSKLTSLGQNTPHNFAMSHSMMLFRKNALYSFIPKNACSTLRLSTAIDNGCIERVEQGHWIHENNQTFNPTLAEAVKVDYSFVVLRCPFRRLASVFLDKFVAKEPDAWQYRNARERKIDLNELTFREFVLSLESLPLLYSNIHWRPQVDFLLYQDYSDYFSLERFDHAIITLKEKIDFNVYDARSLTNHGTDGYDMKDHQCYTDMCAFELAVMKRNGQCPSYSVMYDHELYDFVAQLYQDDLTLYRDKFGNTDLLSRQEVHVRELDINTVTLDSVQSAADVDFLRDKAIHLETRDLPMALKLMSLAYQARPSGPLIKAKYLKYKKVMEQGKSL
ncbi:hypothetical protein VCHA34P112_170112 [Vibrio chagasii]|nr:hypothetical protein VCHA34P112_170112 [Vibrio chagasii]CAH7017340.1 hypothetical protein VCHA56P515_170114 [Vibrio chagasii]CAH7053703.1 hypothetical protein VCHA53O463_170003 [Vibrio chagasii]